MQRFIMLFCILFSCFAGAARAASVDEFKDTSARSAPACALPTPAPAPSPTMTIDWTFDGMSVDSAGTAATFTPAPVSVAMPVAANGLGVTLQAQLTATATALEVRYCADGAKTIAKPTLRSGYVFAPHEPRIVVLLHFENMANGSENAGNDTSLQFVSRKAASGAARLTASRSSVPSDVVAMISAGGACSARLSPVAESSSKACWVVAAGGGQKGGSQPFDGTLKLPYSLLRAYFNLQNDIDLSKPSLNGVRNLRPSQVSGYVAYQNDDTIDPASAMHIVEVDNVDASRWWTPPAYDAGSGTKQGTSTTGQSNPSSGADAVRRRLVQARPLAAAGASAAKTSDDKTQAPAGTFSWTESPMLWSRITAQYDALGLSFLTQNTTKFLGTTNLLGSLTNGFTASPASPASPASEGAGAKSSSPGDGKAFQSTDTGYFVSNARLTDDGSQYGAFHADLKPLDFAHIASMDYGVKSVFAPTGGLDGVAYFRSFETLASGTAVHAEQAVALGPESFPTGYIDGAVSYVVGNDPAAGKTTIALKDEAHSVNVVPTLDAGLGGFEAFARYGMSGGSQDVVGVLSYDARHVTGRDAPPVAFDAAAGYRTLGSTYTPLLTTVDPFIGEKTLFGTTGLHVIDTKTKDIHDFDVDLSGARTLDPTFTAYTTAGAKLSYVPATQTSIDFAYTRSTIDADMLARQFNVPLPNNTQAYYNNDALTATLGYGSLKKAKSYSATDSFFDGYAQDHASYGELSAGLAWYRKALCNATSSAVACSDPYSHNVVGSAEGIIDKTFGAKFSLGLANDVGSKSGTKSLPANQLLAVAAITARARCDADFAASYTNNSSADSRAFVAGNVFEARADLNVLRAGLGVLRVTYRRAYDASFVYKPGSSSGLFFTLANDDDSRVLTKCTNGKPDPR